jgi:RHS repeat-associated protein
MKIPPTGNRTIFHYDENGRLLAETDGLGVVVKEFIWHGATPVAVVLPPTSTKPERIYYLHADQLNTPRAVVNNTNAVLWRWDPEPFGTALPNEDVDGNGEKLVMNLRYPGQYYDQETGLNYNNFRDYDSSIGRYVQSDPIGLAGGINTYSYTGGNPVNFVDPLGLFLRPPAMSPVRPVSPMRPGTDITPTIHDYFPPMGSATDSKDLPNNVVKFPNKNKPTESCPLPDEDGGDPCEEWLEELITMSLSIRFGHVQIDDLTKQAFNNSVRMFKQSCPLLANQIDYLK